MFPVLNFCCLACFAYSFSGSFKNQQQIFKPPKISGLIIQFYFKFYHVLFENSNQFNFNFWHKKKRRLSLFLKVVEWVIATHIRQIFGVFLFFVGIQEFYFFAEVLPVCVIGKLFRNFRKALFVQAV